MRRNSSFLPSTFGSFRPRGPRMAFDPSPTAWLGAGYSLASSEIKLKTVTAGSNITLPEVTDTEANASTGDIRKVAFGIDEALYQAFNSKAVADRPAKMTRTRSDTVNSSTGVITRRYTSTYYISPGSVEVVSES